MKTLIIVFALLFFKPAQAFVVEVKSGEHTGFSRLVFYHPKNIQLEVKKLENGISIGAQDLITTLQASDVFKRISKARVSKVRLDSGKIFIELSCKCETQLSELEPGVSFIDIGTNTPSIQNSSLPKNIPEGNNNSNHPILPLVTATEREKPFWIRSDISEGVNTTKTKEKNPNVYPDKQILDAFMSGIDQASLRKTEGTTGRENSKVTPTIVSNSGLRELDFLKYGASPFLSENKITNCIDVKHIDDLLDFSKFGELKYENLSKFRKIAISGTMKFNNEGATNLAKLYLSNGFLEEASQYIDWMDNSIEKRILQEINNLLLVKSKDNHNALEIASTCSKKSKFWLFLLDSKNIILNDGEITDLALYFRSLPDEMLELIQEILTRNLSQAGMPDAQFLFDLAAPKIILNPNENSEESKVTSDNSQTEGLESGGSVSVILPMSLEERLDSEIDIKLNLSSPNNPGRTLQLANRLLDDGNIVGAISLIVKLEPSPVTDDTKKSIYDSFSQKFFSIAEESDLLLLNGTSEFEKFLDILHEDQRIALSRQIDDTLNSLPLDTTRSPTETSEKQPFKNDSGANSPKEDSKTIDINPALAEFYEILGKSEMVRQGAVGLLER